MFGKPKIMKVITLVFALFIAAPLFAQAFIEGRWDTGEQQSTVEISTTAQGITGTIVSSDEPRVVGKKNLRNLKKVDDHWEGEIYAFKRERWFDVEIEERGDQLELNISVGFFSTQRTWTRLTTFENP